MAARTITQPWLINKWFDPIFAISMGFCAAALRIRREGIEQHPERDSSYSALWSRTTSMSRGYFGYDRTPKGSVK